MFIRQIAAALLAALSLAAFPAMAAVDANQASQSELETIKGIGPGLSGKIVAARQQSAFKDWPDLVDRVGGVGPGNAARFSQAGLTVAGKPYSLQATGQPGTVTAAGTARTGAKAATGSSAPSTSGTAEAAARPTARKPAQP
jgi:competence protein ComEA